MDNDISGSDRGRRDWIGEDDAAHAVHRGGGVRRQRQVALFMQLSSVNVLYLVTNLERKNSPIDLDCMFCHPAWVVGSYSSRPPAGGFTQNLSERRFLST